MIFSPRALDWTPKYEYGWRRLHADASCGHKQRKKAEFVACLFYCATTARVADTVKAVNSDTVSSEIRLNMIERPPQVRRHIAVRTQTKPAGRASNRQSERFQDRTSLVPDLFNH